MEPFIGQIQPFGFNFPPRGWAFCDGQLLAIASNTALFSLLGTTFGGDGRTTFQLPDLRGRTIKHPGNGPGLSTVTWGQRGGAETHTLTAAQMPSHNHNLTLGVNPGRGSFLTGSGNYVSEAATIFTDSTSGTVADTAIISNNGGNQLFDMRNPYLGIYVSIALLGIFPSRS